MARYRKVDVRMWLDAKFARLSKPEPNAQTLWVYLLTNPDTTNIPGLFRSGEAAISEALGWPLNKMRACFAELVALGMAKADWRARLVWIPNAIRYNPPENPNVIKGWRAAWDELPECQLKEEAFRALKEFAEGLPKGFGEGFAKGFREPFPKGLANQEQEQEQEQETTGGALPRSPTPPDPSDLGDLEPPRSKHRSPKVRPEPSPDDVRRADEMRESARQANPEHAWAPDGAWKRERVWVRNALRLARERDGRSVVMLDTIAKRWGELPSDGRGREWPERGVEYMRRDIPKLYAMLTSTSTRQPFERGPIRPQNATESDWAQAQRDAERMMGGADA